MLDFLVFRVLKLESFELDASQLYCHELLFYAYSMKLLLEILVDTLNKWHDLLLYEGLNCFCPQINYQKYHIQIDFSLLSGE